MNIGFHTIPQVIAIVGWALAVCGVWYVVERAITGSS